MFRGFKFWPCLLLLGIFTLGQAWAWTVDIKVPPLRAPLMDEAQLLSAQENRAINQALQQLNQSGAVQMAILITPSLEGHDIAQYALGVAERWQLGKKGKDNGLLFVLAPEARRMRMEVGYGLEGILTDALTRRIQDNIVVPEFRRGNYFQGIAAAIGSVAKNLNLDLSQQGQAFQAPRSSKIRLSPSWIVLLGLLVIGLQIFVFIVRLKTGARIGRTIYSRSGGWGSGGSGWGGGGGFSSGGGFSGGGGSFGGGGSSSSW